jgi:hypothetical protein
VKSLVRLPAQAARGVLNESGAAVPAFFKARPVRFVELSCDAVKFFFFDADKRDLPLLLI